MAENRGFDVLDYIVLLVKWKKFLLIFLVSVFVLSYAAVYFSIPEEFESTAVIIPSGSESSMGGVSGLMKNLKDLPLGLGGTSKTTETDLYMTIVYSRSTLEKLIKKFNLMQDYKLTSMEESVKSLSKKIFADVTEQNAFRVTVRARTPQKSADMVNYLLSLMNETIIDLNVSKSRNNREFLEKRYQEIKNNLKEAEDSLQIYQQRSGILEAKEQPKLILDAYSKLESEITSKQVELSIMEKIVAKDSPQLNLLRTQLQEYKNEFERMGRTRDKESLLLPVNSLPEKTKNYLRYFRNVEVYNAILEFIIPLYEQAKFEEQKNIPVLQVIDYGRVPERKAYPPRTLIAAVSTLIIVLFILLLMILKLAIGSSSNPKVIFIRGELGFRRAKQIDSKVNN